MKKQYYAVVTTYKGALKMKQKIITVIMMVFLVCTMIAGIFYGLSNSYAGSITFGSLSGLIVVGLWMLNDFNFKNGEKDGK